MDMKESIMNESMCLIIGFMLGVGVKEFCAFVLNALLIIRRNKELQKNTRKLAKAIQISNLIGRSHEVGLSDKGRWN